MIMAELNGPHVPRFVANGDFAVQPYIVMEYVPVRRCWPGAPTGLPDSRRWSDAGIAIATAVGDLHEQHVLHLDLKPANVLFRPAGEAVLIDFGLSRHEQLPDLLEEQFHRPTGTTGIYGAGAIAARAIGQAQRHLCPGSDPVSDRDRRLPFGAAGRMKHVRRRVWRDPCRRARSGPIPPALAGNHPELPRAAA